MLGACHRDDPRDWWWSGRLLSNVLRVSGDRALASSAYSFPESAGRACSAGGHGIGIRCRTAAATASSQPSPIPAQGVQAAARTRLTAVRTSGSSDQCLSAEASITALQTAESVTGPSAWYRATITGALFLRRS